MTAPRPEDHESSPHFSHDELKCHAIRFGVRVDCPHCGGANLVTQALLDALEDLRLVAGSVPITVDSAYRCPAHNLEVGGVPGSEHTRGTAADIRIHGMSPRAMYEAARLVPAFLHGGIGVDEHRGYVHVDVRQHTARWCYDASGVPCAWDPALDRDEVAA